MKKLISLLLSLIIITGSCFAGAFSAYADYTDVSTDCTKILLVGNSYTYYNSMDQILCSLGTAAGRDLLVVSAVNSGSDAKELLKENISYFAWYQNKRIEKGTDTLANISKIDFGGIDRADSWDYVVLQNNASADITAIGDAHMLAFFSDKLESNKHFIINSNYWRASLKKDRHAEHYALANSARTSLIDTRGIFAQYNKVFKNRVWCRDLSMRDLRNHPSVRGSYIFALCVYAKIFGVEDFPSAPEDENMLELYNSDLGTIKEFLDTDKFKNVPTEYPSITKADAAKLQYLVRSYAPYYIGGSVENGDASLPSGSCSEKIMYTDSNGKALNGWHTLGDYEYYLSDGVIAKGGLKHIGSKTYYIDDFGERHRGWLTYNGNRYYLLKDGSIAKGWQKLKCDDGKTGTFYFKSNGVLVTGLNKIGSKTYYFSNGLDGSQKGVMYRSCWHKYTVPSGVTYKKYYNAKGEMLIGFHKIKGKRYYFNKKGNLKRNTLFNAGGATYYADKNGIVKHNKIIEISGKSYYFDKSGKMVKDKKFTFRNKTYRADKTGALKQKSKPKAKEKSKAKQKEKTKKKQ